MPVEFIGMISAQDRSETRPPSGPVIDPAHVLLGVTTFLIRGFDPIGDAAEYGRKLLPLVRAAAGYRTRAIAA
jgi:hypothetical protein